VDHGENRRKPAHPGHQGANLAESSKSVLLVDFDSVHRSLTGAGGEAAARLVTRVPGWLKGLTSGRLLGPDERTFVIKRCYADPKAIGEGRMSFQAAGFEVVDCPATTAGRGVDLMMAMDALEQLADDDEIGEFVLLSGEPTLAPLLARLKRKERRTAIYADTQTAQAYRMLADSVLDIATFAEFLLTHDAPEGAATQTVDRSEIEALARRVHAATNIPLFSPRTFGELFRLLTEEIIDHGYHFQTTAKNVADRLSESGRSVTRRQVVFIVKGLALKGHVFSTSDSTRKLAEVFREQARYLIENAGLKLDEGQERILTAWLVDRVPTSVGRAPAPPPPAAPRQSPPLNGGSRPSTETAPPPAYAAARATPPPAPEPRTSATKAPERPPVEKTAPAAMEKAAPSPREGAVEKTPTMPPAPPAAPAREPRAPGSMISPDDARAAIAAKIAQSVRPKPGAARPGPKPAAAAAATPPPPPPPPEDEEAEEGGPESIENSILAAIAEAVDVLVEDGGESAKAKRASAAAPSAKRRVVAPAAAGGASRPAPEARPQAAERPAAQAAKPRSETRRPDDAEDIGDEIQRIIATYNRNRKEEPPA
jgi:hypothetical protein